MRFASMSVSLAVLLTVTASIAASAQSAGRIGVSVQGARNDNGSVRCGLFNSANGFREAGREFRGAVGGVRNGQATCIFTSIPRGTYAVAVFHAEHNEAQMETGMFGKPKQGYGFSRNPSSSFGPPDFASAAFTFDGSTMTLPVRLTY